MRMVGCGGRWGGGWGGWRLLRSWRVRLWSRWSRLGMWLRGVGILAVNFVLGGGGEGREGRDAPSEKLDAAV